MEKGELGSTSLSYFLSRIEGKCADLDLMPSPSNFTKGLGIRIDFLSHQITKLFLSDMNIFNDPSDSELEPFSEDLIPSAARLEARITETDFDGLLAQPLKLHEDLSKGCGGKIWQAGNILASYVLQNFDADKVRGKKIVELGAGGGLVGLDFPLFQSNRVTI